MSTKFESFESLKEIKILILMLIVMAEIRSIFVAQQKIFDDIYQNMTTVKLVKRS